MAKEWRERNLAKGSTEIGQLRKRFHVQEKSPYHFRVNEVLDIYPVRRRYHDILHDERGDVGKSIVKFVEKFFGKDYKPVEKPEVKAEFGKPKWEPAWMKYTKK